MAKIIISTINYNNAKDTIECLEEIEKLSINDNEITAIIIDNASIEKFSYPENILKNNVSLVIKRSEKNLGFSGGHNLAIHFAIENNADYIVILNNDVLLDKNLIMNLLEEIKANQKFAIVVPKIYFAKGYEFHKDKYKKEELGKVLWYAGGEIDWKNVLAKHRGVDEVDNGQYDKGQETAFATGCCMLIKTEVLKKIGTFDERYFLYFEDNDLSQRVKKKGYKIYFVPKAVLWHKNASSAGGSGSVLQDYYITRNRLLFGITYAPIRSKIALIRESLNIIKNGRPWQRKGAIDFYKRNFYQGSYR